VSLSSTLGMNEKVEQHIRKKTHKPNALRFWVESGVIPLYVGSILILVRSPKCFPLEFPNKWYQSRWFTTWTSRWFSPRIYYYYYDSIINIIIIIIIIINIIINTIIINNIIILFLT